MVTPVSNGAAWIRGAIESVLEQHYPNLEYFIIDEESTDGTLDVVQRYQDRISGVVSRKTGGMYDAIRQGFALGSGELLAYLNCDDRLEPGALLRVGAWFRAHPEADVIYHSATVDAGGWKYPNVAQPQVNFARLLRGHILFQEAVFWRRRAYDAVGGLNPNLKVAGDWDLWVRMARRTRFVRRPGHPSCFTLRPDQLSKRMDVYWDEVRERQMAILPTLTARERLGIWWERSSERVRRYLASLRRPDRLFWPIDWREFPPPEMRMPPGLRLPRCPVRGTSPDCLLFSARGQYVYYFGKTHVAGCSQPPGEMVPIPSCGSPYRDFRGHSYQVKLARKIPAPGWLKPHDSGLVESRIDVMSAPYEVPPGQTFDQIVLDHRLDQLEDPAAALRRLAMILAPRGRVVVMTPNLDSAQIDMFGPTWAHWGRGYTFSVRSLELLARSCGFKLQTVRTISRPEWTAASLLRNQRGLGVEDACEIPSEVTEQARSIAAWSRLLWDWRGRGDAIVARFERAPLA